MMVMVVDMEIITIIHMLPGSIDFIAHIWDSIIMLPIIQVIIMIPGIGITTGTDHLYILVITGVGDVDIHTIILTTIIGMAITRVIGMAIMLPIIMVILQMVITMVQEHPEAVQTVPIQDRMDFIL